MPRKRTSKGLAQRIADLDYFKKPAPLRRWKFWLSLAVPAVAVLWIGVTGVRGEERIYTAGPMSRGHAFIGKRCEVCHVPVAGDLFRRHVPDNTCLACHFASVHHADQAFTPTCASCHTEHRASRILTDVGDQHCTQCHADLRTLNGQPHFVRTVVDLGSDHPEFAPLRAGATDPGTVKVNHFVHLKSGLQGPKGPVDMTCEDCHQLKSASEEWKYAVAGTSDAGVKFVEPVPGQMQPIRYSVQCAACHLLRFDPLIAEPAPHEKPEVVHKFVVERLTGYIASHPDALRQAPAAPRIVGQPPAPAPRNAQEWVAQRTATAERLLWGKTCKECHTVNVRDGALPQIAESKITQRWLPHAKFDHRAHMMLRCESCHTKAPKSQETTDVLIPGIATCRQCHASSTPNKEASSDDRCFECHYYHDHTKDHPVKGGYDILDLRSDVRGRH